MEKQALRKVILERRKQLSAEERREKSKTILENILQKEEYKKAERVFVYISMGAEVETTELIQQAWRGGKTVAVPKTAKGRKMYFLPMTSFEALEKSKFGVYEPIGGEEDTLIPQEDDLFLIPGVVFDTKKNRMGYGGGYYDRYFAENREIRKIGLAFQMQVQEEEIPTEETDIPLDEIITENGVII